ncbi:MAG: c-type cytochrome [Rhizobiales bacterium]|nr:c-type cytochrome [Hyphomicrobiales bacterium]
MRVVSSRFALAAIAAGLVLGFGAGASASEKGKQLFVKNGCWQCHGFVGQGGVAGPALAPNVMPVEAMSSFVRNSNRAMPPYREAVLPEADLKEIHAYLTSIPKPADPKSIPLLNQ